MAKKTPKKKSQHKPKAGGAQAKGKRAKPAASAKSRPAAPRAKARAKPAQAVRAKPAKAKRSAARKPAPMKASRSPLAIENQPTPEATAPVAEAAAEDSGLENVMASLSKIFGGREFLSDAELDDFLDSKIASGEIPPSAALDPLDEAQSLIYEAWNSPEPQRIRLAHRALELSPECADAYVILAEEEAKDKKAALELYRKGVEAGRRALGAAFKTAEGRFWDVMETRPYMRARLGLAESLWESGKKEEALEHLRDLLRLNPSDNQGVRYILVQCLLDSGSDEELGEWLERFKHDPSPSFKYTHALWTFRRGGAGKAADARLDAALKANPHVPPYLLKRKPTPKHAPEAVGPGSEDEAAAYAMGALDPWHRTLGAVEWLARRAG